MARGEPLLTTLADYFALGVKVNRQTMFRWLSSDHQKIRNDRKQLEVRTRRLLQSYLTANEWQKRQYYQAIAGAATQPWPVDGAVPLA